MFSLITVLIAIVLVTVLALSTIYFGGNAFRQGGDKAQVAQLLNESEQVRAALTIYEATHDAKATSMQELIDSKALTAAPTGWQLGDGFTFNSSITEAVCLGANARAGFDSSTVPACDTADSAVPCCRATS
jgi:hypothetical protein